MIIDNINKKLGEFLQQEVKDGSSLDIISAYFTIYAFDKLKSQLNNANQVNLLFGQPNFINSIDPTKTDAQSFSLTSEYDHINNKLVANLNINNALQQSAIAKECHHWFSSDKVKVKTIVDRFVHGKMYLVKRPNDTKIAVLGSSNFTCSGLGFSNNSNIEVNINVEDSRDYEDMKKFFDELWDSKNVQDVKAEILNYLTKIYSDKSPEYVMLKTFYKLCESRLQESGADFKLDEKKDVNFLKSAIWNKLYEFQKDGVKGCIGRIKKWNGCILADSVGLGKTFEALAVIKYFQLNGERVLVLSPKKLEQNWIQFQRGNTNSVFSENNSEYFDFDYNSHTDLREDFQNQNKNWGQYGLVVIDESHNFRNDNRSNTQKLSRYQFLLKKVLQSGTKTKVLLLSATPINNGFDDLKNQLKLITTGNDQHFNQLGISSLDNYFRTIKTIFNQWIEDNQTITKLLQKLDSRLFRLLTDISVSRSRRQIIKHYSQSLDAIGNFPKRLPPVNIYPQGLINTDDQQNRQKQTFENLNEIIKSFNLSIYKPSNYLLVDEQVYDKYDIKYQIKDGRIQRIDGFDQYARENFLVGMMQVNLLKRLESSVVAFNNTIIRLKNKIDLVIEKINKQIEPNQDLDIDNIDDQDLNLEDLEGEDEPVVGAKQKYHLDDLNLQKWKQDLEQDQQKLEQLIAFTSQINPQNDQKLIKLEQFITQKQNNQLGLENNGNPKILIFTSYTDTANYLWECLSAIYPNQTAVITGSTGANQFTQTLDRFSPISRNANTNQPIDILIATDCISEGQNLQGCDCVINYDIHWNPVNLIQRFGRIDRLGSQNQNILMVNFWPTANNEAYLNLELRVKAKMVAVSLATDNQENVVENQHRIEQELNFRDQQIIQMQNEVIDLEDDNSLDLSDFSLDEYFKKLLDYLEKNKNDLAGDPWGIYAVVQTTEQDANQIPSGVIFCLENIDKAPNQEVAGSQFGRIFLVYVSKDENNQPIIKYAFNNPKPILDAYLKLCQGKNQAITELCQAFNQETENGKNMQVYSELATKAIENIFQIQPLADLQAIANGTAIGAEIQTGNFSLATMLIIK